MASSHCCHLPAEVLLHVHQVDALSMKAVAVHVRAALCDGHLSHTGTVFRLNCEENGKLSDLCHGTPGA